MELFLVEHYQPGVDPAGLHRSATVLREATARLGRAGKAVRYVSSTIVPGDEALLSLFEAATEDAIREAHDLAGVPLQRISRAVDAETGHTDKEEK